MTCHDRRHARHGLGNRQTEPLAIRSLQQHGGASLLEERADDPERWRARQVEGMAWAQRFDWQAHARATMDVYREALAAVASDNGRSVAQT